MTAGPLVGEDGLARCPWADSPADYRAYHDREWGHPVRGDDRIFERLSLEGFQSGLSWLTILRRRDAFREAFADFDPRRIAEYDEVDVDRLVADARIIRHRGKIEATVSNARVLVDWQAADGVGVLDDLVWSFASESPAPQSLSDVPVSTTASESLTRQLKARGWRFLGPTSAYAAMQAIGVVNDHLAGCHARSLTRSTAQERRRR